MERTAHEIFIALSGKSLYQFDVFWQVLVFIELKGKGLFLFSAFCQLHKLIRSKRFLIYRIEIYNRKNRSAMQ